MTRQNRAAAGRARGTSGKTTTERVPGVPRVNLVRVVERYFGLVQRTVDINRRLAVRWAKAVGTLSGTVREKADPAGGPIREQAEVADLVLREQAGKAQRTALEQAEKAERAEQGLARQARRAEREQARRTHKRARERYEGLPKADLSEQLAKRELPKTGNVDQLIERLVEADSK